jgi:hypothetical protein
MTPAPREKELVRKLVRTWYLSGSEHREIPGGLLRGSLIYEAIEEVLEAEGRFPVDWQPDESFVEGLIERQEDGSYRITWKAGPLLMHHAAVVVKEYRNLHEAVAAFAPQFFGGDIDGIAVDWSA